MDQGIYNTSLQDRSHLDQQNEDRRQEVHLTWRLGRRRPGGEGQSPAPPLPLLAAPVSSPFAPLPPPAHMHWMKRLVKHDDECSLRLDQGLYDMMMEQKKGIQPRLALSLLLPALPVSLPSACVHMLNQGLVHGNSFRARLGFPLFLPFLPVAFPSACRHILDQGCIWKPSGRWQTLATDQHRCQFCMSHCPLHNCRCLQHPSNSTTIS